MFGTYSLSNFSNLIGGGGGGGGTSDIEIFNGDLFLRRGTVLNRNLIDYTNIKTKLLYEFKNISNDKLSFKNSFISIANKNVSNEVVGNYYKNYGGIITLENFTYRGPFMNIIEFKINEEIPPNYYITYSAETNELYEYSIYYMDDNKLRIKVGNNYYTIKVNTKYHICIVLVVNNFFDFYKSLSIYYNGHLVKDVKQTENLKSIEFLNTNPVIINSDNKSVFIDKFVVLSNYLQDAEIIHYYNRLIYTKIIPITNVDELYLMFNLNYDTLNDKILFDNYNYFENQHHVSNLINIKKRFLKITNGNSTNLKRLLRTDLNKKFVLVESACYFSLNHDFEFPIKINMSVSTYYGYGNLIFFKLAFDASGMNYLSCELGANNKIVIKYSDTVVGEDDFVDYKTYNIGVEIDEEGVAIVKINYNLSQVFELFTLDQKNYIDIVNRPKLNKYETLFFLNSQSIEIEHFNIFYR